MSNYFFALLWSDTHLAKSNAVRAASEKKCHGAVRKSDSLDGCFMVFSIFLIGLA